MKRIDFENGSVTQNIFAAALPMLVAQILNLLYNIVGPYLISHESRILEQLHLVLLDCAFRWL